MEILDQETMHKVKEESKTWGKRLARTGYLAAGMLYILVGLLIFQAAFGLGRQDVDQNVLLVTLLQSHPFGPILLAALAFGLIVYAVWRLALAILDPESEGTGLKGLGVRTGNAVTGLFYASLGLMGTRLVFGQQSSVPDSEQTGESLTAAALANPVGRALVGIVGLAVLVFGIYQVYRAITFKINSYLTHESMSPEEQSWTVRIARVGFTARAIIYCVIGFLILNAAITLDSEQVGGFGQAIKTLVTQPYGSLIVALLAVGMVAYGFYFIVLARFRRMPI